MMTRPLGLCALLAACAVTPSPLDPARSLPNPGPVTCGESLDQVNVVEAAAKVTKEDNIWLKRQIAIAYSTAMVKNGGTGSIVVFSDSGQRDVWRWACKQVTKLELEMTRDGQGAHIRFTPNEDGTVTEFETLELFGIDAFEARVLRSGAIRTTNPGG